MKLHPNYNWKLRLALGLALWLQRLGLAPGHEAMARWPVDRRKALKPQGWMTYPAPRSVRTSRETIPGSGGPLVLKWFRTQEQQPPSILFIHGGGWVVGGVDSLDYLCANLCDRLGVAVAAVDYRLAPEHRFPAALEDCHDALAWLSARAPGPLVVAGDSAGGNLCAALCLLARDRGGPPIAQQTLIYAALDATLESPSMVTNEHDGLMRSDLARALRWYLGDHDPRDALVSPIHAPSLAGLPPAFIVTADCDILRDDGPRYAERLRAAGVPVRCVNHPGMPHGFLSQPRLCPGAPAALEEIIEEIGRHVSKAAIA